MAYSKYLNATRPVILYTIHDLRRTFGTSLAQLKVQPHIVERLLNHTMGSIGNLANSVVSAVTEVYNLATYLPEMRQHAAISNTPPR